MAMMPAIDDDMVELFRQTGRRRASYSNSQGTRSNSSVPRVVQQANGCEPCYPGQIYTYCTDPHTGQLKKALCSQVGRL
jgi:hypothetical protein